MFYRIIINSWADALLLIERMTDKVPDWAFRGQSDERWDLSTKFEREARKYQSLDSYWFKNREHYVLQDFQRRAHHYVDKLPVPENYIEWLSLLQHYGGPTRLLDFTYSFYVSLFFAVETSTFDSVIWAVNINKLITQLSKIDDLDLKKAGPSFGKIIKQNNELAQNIIQNRKIKDIVYIVEPFQQHERISIQQGLFLFPGNIEMPFEHNLCSVFEFNFKELTSNNATEDRVYSKFHTIDFSNASIVKIVIPAKLHSQVLLELRKMNVTSASLFPGLDGFARSLSFRFGELDYHLHRTEDF